MAGFITGGGTEADFAGKPNLDARPGRFAVLFFLFVLAAGGIFTGHLLAQCK